MYDVKFTHTVEKQYDRLDSSIQDRVIAVFERIKMRPLSFVKRKVGTPYFLARIGNHRAVLDISEKNKKIIVIEIGHRKNIYK